MTFHFGGDGAVVVWCEPDRTASPLPLLTAAERLRYDRFRVDDDRARFATGRALLRSLLAAATGESRDRVDLDTTCPTCGDAHGAPRSARGHLSLSHSGERVVAAWSTDVAVGVDVEFRRRDVEPGLWDLVLADGESRDDFDGDFFVAWARKEAVLKSRGVGLTEPMTDVPLDRCPEQLTSIDVGPDYAGALAVARPVTLAVHPMEHWSDPLR